ncbi:MAG: hypothetical protein AAB702_01895 [Patescibacteria group bacterium]
MRERLTSVPISNQIEGGQRSQEPTLRESLVGKKGKLPKDQTRVARMLNYLDLSLEQKRLLFFYHLWHETSSFAPIKQFIELKEDPFDFLIDPVLKNDNLVGAYADFYNRYEEKNRTKSRFQERLDEILPLRGLYPIAEISRRTGYTENYIKSIFKRALKRGLVKSLDKKEIAERDPRYEYHRIIRKGIQRLRNSDDYRYSEQEIADILAQEFGRVVTKQQVKRQIRLLLRDGKIERRINQLK